MAAFGDSFAVWVIFAKSFPVPAGTTASMGSARAPLVRSPFATSWTVPSPPTATTRSTRPTAPRASTEAWPGPVVSDSSTSPHATRAAACTSSRKRALRP